MRPTHGFDAAGAIASRVSRTRVPQEFCGQKRRRLPVWRSWRELSTVTLRSKTFHRVGGLPLFSCLRVCVALHYFRATTTTMLMVALSVAALTQIVFRLFSHDVFP